MRLTLALEGHGHFADRPRSEFLAFVEQVIDEIRRVTADLPQDRIRLHACWGNYEGPHDADVPIAEMLPILTQAHAGCRAAAHGQPAATSTSTAPSRPSQYSRTT